MTTGSDPYRSPPVEPQFVCVVCYASLSAQPGACKKCGVDRLPLGDPAVRADVRAEAEKRLQQKVYGEWFWCYLVAAAAAALFIAFPLTGGLFGGFVWVGATMLLGTLNVKLYERLNPHSTLRLYADRRARLAAPAQKALPPPTDAPPPMDAPPQAPPPSSADPEGADLPRVLTFLGARVDE
jgi:hypothetical protein